MPGKVVIKICTHIIIIIQSVYNNYYKQAVQIIYSESLFFIENVRVLPKIFFDTVSSYKRKYEHMS